MMNLSPNQRYYQQLDSGKCIADVEQLKIINRLEHLYQAIITQNILQKPKFWQRFSSKKQVVKGLYLWGEVGRGKTWLMDLFYESLPTSRKYRCHFHRFMQQIHQSLTQLQGQTNPLTQIARQFAASYSILCFDEFFVNDITDAMILGNLLKALLAEHIVIVLTSNTPPAQLYRNGLQRELFLPAITLLENNLEVVKLQSQMDYRLRALTQAGTYFYPLNALAEQNLKNYWEQSTQGNYTSNVTLEISGRPLMAVAVANNIIWFDFMQLCNIPRSQNDYLELVAEYEAILLSNIPQLLGPSQDDLALYLIYLVDVCYDAGTKLIISAAVPVTELYQGERQQFAFQRTKSRLLEMQSEEYLARGR